VMLYTWGQVKYETVEAKRGDTEGWGQVPQQWDQSERRMVVLLLISREINHEVPVHRQTGGACITEQLDILLRGNPFFQLLQQSRLQRLNAGLDDRDAGFPHQHDLPQKRLPWLSRKSARQERRD
jgi:hypothetical protein